MDLDLAGTRVMITAAGAGIGAATARHFAALGARVWVCDVDDRALAEVMAIDGVDGTAADVADTASVDEFVRTGLDVIGGVDVLVNNAGVAGP
ncbi:MAG: SDR family NAD(P)-dependent oxidoreductase, partial [Ilumatobacteraceae bacterium]